MKKILTLILAAIICFALCACAKDKTQDISTTTPIAPDTTVAQTQSTEELLIGTWTCQREEGQDNISQATVYTIELYQGGTCYTYNLGTEDYKKYNNISGTWALTGNVLVITYPKANLGFVIDMSVEPYTLTKQIDSTVILHKTTG